MKINWFLKCNGKVEYDCQCRFLRFNHFSMIIYPAVFFPAPAVRASSPDIQG